MDVFTQFDIPDIDICILLATNASVHDYIEEHYGRLFEAQDLCSHCREFSPEPLVTNPQHWDFLICEKCCEIMLNDDDDDDDS